MAAFIALTSAVSMASADDRFGIAVGVHNALMVVGSNGQNVAEISGSTVAEPVTVGGTSFQVSFGRDANDLLTAVLTPSISQPQDLHFSVMDKSVDADKQAVVTLTFSPGLKYVSIDPGYTGIVRVDSHVIKPHNVATDGTAQPAMVSDLPTPAASTPADGETPEAPALISQVASDTAPIAPTAPAAPSTSVAQDAATTAAAPIEAPVSQAPVSTPASAATPATSISSSLAPMTPAPMLALPVAATPAAPVASDSTPIAGAALPEKKTRLFWSEPVTSPDGHAPEIALNEMKLVEMDGPVSVTMADGSTVAGSNGMVVPSGATVSTSATASVAIFMGGVDSARMMPNSQLAVQQQFDGSLRRVIVSLDHGAVFSRIGTRPGETQNFQVITAEGVAMAGPTEMLAYRGNYDEFLRYQKGMTMNMGSYLDKSRLLAWNPSTLGRGLISDSPGTMFGASLPVASLIHSYFYCAAGKFTVSPGAKLDPNSLGQTTVSGTGHTVGTAVYPPAGDSQQMLQAILLQLQPHNAKLKDLLYRENSGTGTPGDVAFYNNLITVFFGTQVPAIEKMYAGDPNYKQLDAAAASRVLYQDLLPFGTNPLTPY